MEFESNVGDLASLLKVEKKRAAAMRADSRLVICSRHSDRYIQPVATCYLPCISFVSVLVCNTYLVTCTTWLFQLRIHQNVVILCSW